MEASQSSWQHAPQLEVLQGMRNAGTLQSVAKSIYSSRSRHDARSRKRAKLILPALVWPFDPKYRHQKEIGRVTNFTRDGLYFTTKRDHYFVGMKLLVTFPFVRKAPRLREFLGTVVRVESQANGAYGVAIRFIF